MGWLTVRWKGMRQRGRLCNKCTTRKYYVYIALFIYIKNFTATNSPVVPAGAISLRCFTTSSLSDCFALFARQRINRLVPGSGCSIESWFSCKESLNWSTTSLESHGCDIIVSMALLGREITFSSIPAKETNFNNTSTILSNYQRHILLTGFSFVFFLATRVLV